MTSLGREDHSRKHVKRAKYQTTVWPSTRKENIYCITFPVPFETILFFIGSYEMEMIIWKSRYSTALRLASLIIRWMCFRCSVIPFRWLFTFTALFITLSAFCTLQHGFVWFLCWISVYSSNNNTLRCQISRFVCKRTRNAINIDKAFRFHR